MKQLPIGAQSFEVLRESDYVYVDKTKYILDLTTNGRLYFLSRPRRFGKSLLISTLKELFKSNKKLFEGLYIYDKWDWGKTNPIIHLDWTEINYETPEKLEQELANFLNAVAVKHNLKLNSSSNVSAFSELIEKLRDKYDARVVVLVDEYDKPITDNLPNEEILSANKRILHDFYQAIKANDEHLNFVFLAGVSKFSGLSVFSALNNINDITVDKKYAAICGYTQEELEGNFKEYVIALSKELHSQYDEIIAAVKDWYNGYSWDGKISLYNPFSTLMLFDKKRFANYWFRTGTPTFLLNLIRKHNRPQDFIATFTAPDSSFESYNPDNLNEIPLLFQTGYLTIKNVESGIKGVQYTLDFPDAEVKDSFLQYLLSEYTAYPQESMPELFKELSSKLQNSDA